MKLKNLLPVKNLEKSFKLFKLNWNLVPLCILIDILFIFSIGYIVAEIYAKMIEHLVPMVEIMQQSEAQIGNLITSQIDLINVLSQKALFMDHYISVIFLAGLFIVLVYALYNIFQGINWFIANKIANKKAVLCRFLARFSFVNFVWFILLVLVGIFFVKFFMSTSTSMSPVVSSQFIVYTSIFMIAIVVYFALISYSLINKLGLFKALKNTFLIGYKKFRNIFSIYLIIIILFVITDLILRLIYKIHPTVMFIAGLFTVLPLITFARVYLIESMEKIKK